MRGIPVTRTAQHFESDMQMMEIFNTELP